MITNLWIPTHQWQCLFSGRQDVFKDQEQDKDGQEYRHLEAKLLTTGVTDEERSQIQAQQKQQGQDYVDEVKKRLPLQGDL